jgi:hypothetical protein
MFNNEKAKTYQLFIFTSRNKDIENYLNKTCKIINIEEKGTLKRLYSIECKEEFKNDWKNIMKGNYSLVNKDTVNNIIIPTLKGNKRDWKNIFNQDHSGLKKTIERKFPKLEGQALRKVVEDTIKDLKKVNLTIELKEPIKKIENKIIYDY